MNIKIDKEWILKKAKEEEGVDIAAGSLEQTRPILRSYAPNEDEIVEQWVFSKLIEFLRRERGLTVAKLAEQARIELTELIAIENDRGFIPKPRTVHQLAKFFGLPDRKLLELSNVTTTHTPDVQEAAVRFAANAKKVMELDKDERRALNDFVKFLSTR